MAERVVFITGAAGNLGRAVADVFTAEGARLVLVGSRAESLERSFPDIAARHLKLAADLADEAEAGRAVAEAERLCGRIDVLCALAGGFHMGEAVHETPSATWDGMMRINVATMTNVAKAAVSGMMARKAGKIVTVGANSAMKGVASMGAYTASKATVMRLTEAMAGELRGHGINVNCVLPSILDTPENRAAMPKADPAHWVKTEDLAAVIAFLCSDAARAMHGALVPVVGLS